MNMHTQGYRRLIAAIGVAVLATACSTPPKAPDGASSARARLTQLQSNPELATRATVELRDAEAAVRAAEEPTKDAHLGRHLVLMADRKVDIAGSRAQARLYADQRKGLSEASATARLDARTREADNLRRQLADLNAKETERGMVVTLGDVLFATGRAELKGGALANLGKLAAFLNENPDRTVAIEGHTDSVGSEESNYTLSRRRADAVKSYLVGQGVSSGRLDSLGKGEGYPVADNESATGRQQNRRVEVIIANTAVSSR